MLYAYMFPRLQHLHGSDGTKRMHPSRRKVLVSPRLDSTPRFMCVRFAVHVHLYMMQRCGRGILPLPLWQARRCSGVSMLLKESRSRMCMLHTVHRLDDSVVESCRLFYPWIVWLALMLIRLSLCEAVGWSCQIWLWKVWLVSNYASCIRYLFIFHSLGFKNSFGCMYLSLYMLLGLLEKWTNCLFVSSRTFHSLLDLGKASKSVVKHSVKTGKTDLQRLCLRRRKGEVASLSVSASVLVNFPV
jgi:hypothetical protein